MLDAKKVQSTNTTLIIGTLNELDIEEKTSGEGKAYISGRATIKVDQEISGKMVENIIPVRMFSMRLKKDGTQNPIYDSIKRMKEQFTSLAAADEPSQASRVVVSGGRIEENIWLDKSTGEPRTTWQISTNFMRKANPDDTDIARFEITGVIGSIASEVNKDGDETGRLKLSILPVGYLGKIDRIELIAENPTAVNHIQSNWEKEDTVSLAGLINMSYKVETWTEEVGFGEPIKRQRTVSRKELIITSGSPSCLEEDICYDIDGIKAGLAERTARIEALKSKAAKPKAAPAKSNDDFGF